MPDFYLIRHGQTEWNAERRVQGFADSLLTPEGERQARATGLELARRLQGESPLLVSSDLWRAHSSAQIIAQALDLSGPVRLETWLRERGLGVAQGRVWDSLVADFPEAMQAYAERSDRDAIPQSEPWERFRARIRSGFLALAALPGPDAIVAVTHGGVIRAMQDWADVDLDGGLPNASCWRFRFDHGRAELLD